MHTGPIARPNTIVDSQGRFVDSQGRPVDAQGRLIHDGRGDIPGHLGKNNSLILLKKKN